MTLTIDFHKEGNKSENRNGLLRLSKKGNRT